MISEPEAASADDRETARIAAFPRDLIRRWMSLGFNPEDAIGCAVLTAVVWGPRGREAEGTQADSDKDRRDATAAVIASIAWTTARARGDPATFDDRALALGRGGADSVLKWCRERHRLAMDGDASERSQGIRAMGADSVVQAERMGFFSRREWFRTLAYAAKSCGRSSTENDAILSEYAQRLIDHYEARGDAVPMMRVGGRVVPAPRQMRDGGGLGRRVRTRRTFPPVAPPTAEVEGPEHEAARREARSLARVKVLGVIERLERLERLSAREAVMVRLSLDGGADPEKWGGRKNRRYLASRGFTISQPGLLKMARRVRAALRIA